MRKRLSARQKAKKAEPRFFGIQPKTERTKKVHAGFLLSEHRSKILIIAFYLVVIAGFAVVLDKTLHATGNDNIATVDFYANASELSGSGNAWAGADRVLGEPQVALDGAAGDFNSGNSAVYSGGFQSLICENFTTADFIKNSAPTVVTSTPEMPPVLENSNSTTSEQNMPAPIISSSTAGISEPSLPPTSSFSVNDASEQNIITPSDQSAVTPPNADNSSAVQPSDSPAPAQDGLSQPASGNSPAIEPADTSAPTQGGFDQPEQNHLPDSAPAADAPVSFLQELKNIAAVSKGELGKTILGQLVLADSQWGSNADDRNILFGPFVSAKIKVSLAAIRQAVAENNYGTSSPAAIDATGTQNIALLGSSSPENPQSPSADSGQTGSTATSTPANPATGIMQKILDFFLPGRAGAQENDPAAAPLVVWYSFADEGDGNVWRQLGTIGADSLSNDDRGGYLTFDAPFLNDWRDLDNLRLKFSGNEPDGGNFAAYLDSVWVEIAYQNGPAKAADKPQNTDKDKLAVDGKEIDFTWTDNNSNENLIIKSDQKEYFGLTSAQMYFSVENTGVRDEEMNFQFYFKGASSTVAKMDELVPHSPYLTAVPKYQPEIYDCANGWDKRGNIWSCYPSGDEHACDEVSPNRRYCRVNGVMTGVEQKIQYADRWQEVGLDSRSIAPQEGFFQKLLGLGPQTKSVPDNFQNKKATAASTTIAPGEVKYFRASLGFPANSEGEFYIEAVGNNDGYGLLDPWWNSGWNYRLPITVDNTGNAKTLSDYQLYLEMSSSTSRDFWRHIKADGSDIRFSNADQTVELPYWIQSFDQTASSAKIWIKDDSIPANAKSKIYLYYGNGGAVSASDQFAPFTYPTLQNIFYTASSSAVKTINVVSLIDDNQVQLDNGTVVNLNRQQIAVFTGFTADSVVKAKGPIMAKISNGGALESAIPISFAGTDFVIPSNRAVENFNAFAPFAAADISLSDGAVLKQTHSLSSGSAWTTTQDIATDSLAIVEATEPILLSFADNGPGDSLLGYPAGQRDLYGVKSQYNLIGASTNSSFSILCSNDSSTTISALPRGALQTNQLCAGGSKGAGNAVRLAGISGAINAIQQDEGTSSESTMFLPFQEFSSEYMLPTDASHLAVVCAPETGRVDLSVYDENNNFLSSSTCAGLGIYPGKAYFGAPDATTYLAGSRIVSTNNQPFYAYYQDTEAAGGAAETNLFGAVQTRNFSAPGVRYAFGSEEIAGPPTGAFNYGVQKPDGSGRVDISIAVNDLSRDDCRAKIEYAEQIGGHCDFGAPLAPTLDESSSSADFGAPVIANKNAYQIGTSTGWIGTATGTNDILFNWLSRKDLPAADGVYCLRLTANDNISDQATPATTTVVIDNAAPTQPGNLTLAAKTGDSVTLKFAATSSDSHFREYRIYYKLYDGTPARATDRLFGSSSDGNLASADFNHATDTTISGLTTGLKYTFNLFADDDFGNAASSSSGLDVTANGSPTAAFNSAAEKTDGSGRVDISFTANDSDHDNTLRAKVEYQAGSKCDFSSSSQATIDTGSLTATFGNVQGDNGASYQIGTPSHYIITSLGPNTINFDWLSHNDAATASGTYCLRLTANDGIDDQQIADDIVVVLDNLKPIAPGNLAVGSSTETSLQLILPTAHPAQDNNEPAISAYRIFYKAGTSGVTTGDLEFSSPALDAYDFNGYSSVVVGDLNPNTHYVFNIWAYDSFGNIASATEVTARTDADLTNKFLRFLNPESTSTVSNIAVADNSSAWDFQARVSDIDGFSSINDVTLGLADNPDNAAPFDDLKFIWTQATHSFAETGADANNAAQISPESTSTCAADSCTIDFQIIFASSFADTAQNYAGELYSTDASLRTADDTFANLFQVRKSWIEQEHYRWRNDNGGG